jgi:hypothetical protein
MEYPSESNVDSHPLIGDAHLIKQSFFKRICSYFPCCNSKINENKFNFNEDIEYNGE